MKKTGYNKSANFIAVSVHVSASDSRYTVQSWWTGKRFEIRYEKFAPERYRAANNNTDIVKSFFQVMTGFGGKNPREWVQAEAHL